MNVAAAFRQPLVLVLAGSVELAAQQPATFIPPRILNAALPAPPALTVAGGGEVLIEAIVARSGTVTRPTLLRSAPPYAQFVLDAIAQWRFLPARTSSAGTPETPVDAPVLIAAVYRPPAMFLGATVGEVPKDLATPTVEVVFPSCLISPVYPPNAANSIIVSTVLFEVSLDETGRIQEARAIVTDPAFESAALDALMQWRFHPALFRGRPARATAYVLFGFRPPVVSSAPGPAPR
jgi:TonB family protein